MFNIFKHIFKKRDIKPIKYKTVIGCKYRPDTIYYCRLDDGNYCGLECGIEHGEYIYSEESK